MYVEPVPLPLLVSRFLVSKYFEQFGPVASMSATRETLTRMYDKDCNGGLELPELVELFEVRSGSSTRTLEALKKKTLAINSLPLSSSTLPCLYLLSHLRVCGWRTARINRFGWLGNMELHSL